MSASEFLGLTSEATGFGHELMELLKPYQGDTALASSFWLVWSHSSHALDEELRELVERAPEGRWKEIALASLDHDFSRAADLWLLSGSPTWEAFLRVRAAEELIETGHRVEGEIELQKAISFYRTVGATFFIQRGEQLLARSA